MATGYRVTAPFVNARVTLSTGVETVAGFYEGAILPDTVVEESLDHLRSIGFVEEVDVTVADGVDLDDDPGAEDPTAVDPAVGPGELPTGGDQGGEPPAKSASKAEWVAYAVSRGQSEDDANASTKDELVELYS